jgi:hypothetical protein
MFIHDRFEIDNEFSNSEYLFLDDLERLQTWQFLTYFFTDCFTCDQ